MTNRTTTTTTTNAKRDFVKALIATLALLSAAAGCQVDPTGGHESNFFPGEGAHRSTSQVMQAQSASGARQDSTLRDVHFDGENLNSLGRQKLALMLDDDDVIDTLLVYMDVNDDVMSSRVASVTDYLEDRGLQTTQIRFETGENPDNYSPAQPHLARMERTESFGNESDSGDSMSPSSGSK